jgi:hypothetical protein
MKALELLLIDIKMEYALFEKNYPIVLQNPDVSEKQINLLLDYKLELESRIQKIELLLEQLKNQ